MTTLSSTVTAQRPEDGRRIHYERRRPADTALYQRVQEHLETFLAQVELETGAGLPEFVKEEFDAFLAGGILAHGFLRLRCADCAHEKLVTFSFQTQRLRFMNYRIYYEFYRCENVMSSTTKVTADLATQLKQNGLGVVDLILELRPPTDAPDVRSHTRSERIATLKEAFARHVAPVEDAIQKAGGNVTGCAWINHTVRARVPSRCVAQLAELEEVKVLDIPHPLQTDGSF